MEKLSAFCKKAASEAYAQRSPLFSGFLLGSYRSKNPENKKRSEYQPLRAAGAVSPDVRRLVAGCCRLLDFILPPGMRFCHTLFDSAGGIRVVERFQIGHNGRYGD
ncbi:hypothetical protein [Paenibacillus cymbidii]|uniref:hypothetical protein n=1 Tax=Paenibacillus cymbidii TaxID=1639034 RepID=UPI001080072D|nr:hypothetical protein [Paenibacillus cymbidii]